VGSIGDLGCFSISSYKIIGGGEGGMVVTSDDRLYDRVCQAAEAGGLWRPERFAASRYDGELFIGGNYRLSELESAINVVQMQKLPDVVARHRRVWARIRAQLGTYTEITWQKHNDPEGDIGYLLRFFPATDDLGRRLQDALAAEGLPAGYRGSGAAPDWHLCRYHYPVLGEDAAHALAETCPVACDLYDRCIQMALNQWWTDKDADAVAAGINKVLSALCTRTVQCGDAK
jgi:dTDP-4-amino-4,6-dideoxygalactose transaminase